MSYTIAVMEDVHGGQKLSFEKSGNEYVVHIYDEESDTYVSRYYPTIDAAYIAFEKISKAIITGCYSFEQRKGFL